MCPMLGATEGGVYDLGVITLERPGVLYVYITVYRKKFVGVPSTSGSFSVIYCKSTLVSTK